MLEGSCLCGGVRYRVDGPVSPPSLCHCTQCRKQSGHVWSSATAPRARVRIAGETLTWYRASAKAERGFCGKCGSFLFWRHDDEDTMSFSMGSVDGPSGVRLGKEIFVASKGDYYDLIPDLPHSDT